MKNYSLVAKRTGTTPEGWKERRAQGLKWCSGCREWHPADQFGRDVSRGDRLSIRCRKHNAKLTRERRTR